MLTPRSLPFLTLAAAATLAASCRRSDQSAASGADSAASAPSDPGFVVQSEHDYGPPATIELLRTRWEQETAPPDTITQVVVVADFGVVEVRNGGRNSPFLVLFKHDQAGSWQDEGLITGPLAVCGLTAHGIPEPVAREIVARDLRLAATNRADPRAGCSGAI